MTMRTERLLISRRDFLQTLSLVASAGLIQACAPTAPAPSTPAASKPAAATPAAQRTTEAKPAGQPTVPPAGAQPTVAPKPAQQAPAAAKPGGTLVAGWDSDPGALDNNVDRGAVTLTENVTLNFAKFHVEYTEQKADGTGAPGGEMGWDVKKNEKI